MRWLEGCHSDSQLLDIRFGAVVASTRRGPARVRPERALSVLQIGTLCVEKGANMQSIACSCCLGWLGVFRPGPLVNAHAVGHGGTYNVKWW